MKWKLLINMSWIIKSKKGNHYFKCYTELNEKTYPTFTAKEENALIIESEEEAELLANKLRCVKKESECKKKRSGK